MAKTAAELRREKLRARQTQAVQNRDKSGLGKKSALDWGKLKVKMPHNFEPKTGRDKNLIDILPFEITQDWYSKLRTVSGNTTNIDVGEWDYKLEIPLHKGIGENNDTFLCLREAFGGKCRVCEDMFEEYAKEEPDDKKTSALRPKWRDFFNVYDYDDEEAGYHVWNDVSYHLFEKNVLEEAEEGEEIILYTDTEEGKSIEFKGKLKKLGKIEFIEAQGIDFIDRDPYEDSIVDQTISFDALLHIPTYEEVARAHDPDSFEDSKNEDSEPEKPKNRNTGNSRKRQVKKEEPAPEPKTDPDNPCPFGRTFGDDCDPNADDCNNCPDESFGECMQKKEQIDLDEELKNKTDSENKDLNEMQIDEEKEKESDNGPTRRRTRSTKEEPKEEEPSARPTRRRTRR